MAEAIDWNKGSTQSDESDGGQMMLLDDSVRGCEVMLVTEPINNQPSSTRWMLNSNSTRHWYLVFCFDDGKVFTCELRNPSGTLYGGPIIINCGPLAWGRISGKPKSFRLGETKTSPKEVYLLAQDIPLNTMTYHAVDRNCHDWALQLLGKIDKNLQEVAISGNLTPLRETSVKGPSLRGVIASQSVKKRKKRKGHTNSVFYEELPEPTSHRNSRNSIIGRANSV